MKNEGANLIHQTHITVDVGREMTKRSESRDIESCGVALCLRFQGLELVSSGDPLVPATSQSSKQFFNPSVSTF